jgi:hypothetical protein
MSFLDGMDLTLTPATTNPNSFGFGMSPGGGGGETINEADGEAIGGRIGGGPGGGGGGVGSAFGATDGTSTSVRKDLGSAIGWPIHPGSRCVVAGFLRAKVSRDTAFRRLWEVPIPARPGLIKTRRLLRHVVGT